MPFVLGQAARAPRRTAGRCPARPARRAAPPVLDWTQREAQVWFALPDEGKGGPLDAELGRLREDAIAVLPPRLRADGVLTSPRLLQPAPARLARNDAAARARRCATREQRLLSRVPRPLRRAPRRLGPPGHRGPRQGCLEGREFHRAFAMFVGESGRPFGAEQLGKPVLADWTTIRNGKVESEGELAVHISESMFAHYQESYRIDIKNPSTGSGMVALAEWARNPDATPRTTKLPDGSRAVLPRWVRAHRPRHHGLRRRWPAQSRAIWQFQENLLRFWEGRPSLQDVCAQAR